MDDQFYQAVAETALEDAWAFLKEIVPVGTEYRIGPDELKLLGVLVVAYIESPKLNNILSIVLEAAYRLGEQA